MSEIESNFSWETFYEAPIIGIIRFLPQDYIIEIIKTYETAGLKTIEVTMNTENAVAIISNLRRVFPNLNIGAGTVCTLQELENAISAGAQFIVTPILDETVVKKAVSENIPIFPGCYTPSEIFRAWSLGASAVKVFPATKLGPQYIKDVLAPLNKVKLLPTGGITKENIESYFKAGAIGVGMGSSLIDKTLVCNKDYAALEHHFKAVKNEITNYLITK